MMSQTQAAITAPKPSTPVAETAEETPVDMEQLRMFTDGDVAEEQALAALFLEQAHEMIAILEQNTGSDTRDTWKSAAHRFKGSAGNLGANKLHQLCKRAESHFEDAPNDKQEILAAITAETNRVEAFFAQNRAA